MFLLPFFYFIIGEITFNRTCLYQIRAFLEDFSLKFNKCKYTMKEVLLAESVD